MPLFLPVTGFRFKARVSDVYHHFLNSVLLIVGGFSVRCECFLQYSIERYDESSARRLS